MQYNSEIHHRQSIRLKEYDYSQNGVYFITICTQNKECLFGEIEDGEMRLNDAGKIIDRWWHKMKNKFPNIELDEYIIMPNHFHGILIIQNVDPVGAILCNRPQGENMISYTGENMVSYTGENMVSPLRIPNSYDGLGKYISWFKRMSINEYIRGVKSGKFPPFEKSIWQRNYFEHIIRDENELNKIREYIFNNFLKWELDKNNPKNLNKYFTRRGVPLRSPCN